MRTGNVIKARDVFFDEKLSELAALVNTKLQMEVLELIKAAREDHQQEDAASAVEALEQLKFDVSNLDDLSINGEGVYLSL